jgi:hypothetical protein
MSVFLRTLRGVGGVSFWLMMAGQEMEGKLLVFLGNLLMRSDVSLARDYALILGSCSEMAVFGDAKTRLPRPFPNWAKAPASPLLSRFPFHDPTFHFPVHYHIPAWLRLPRPAVSHELWRWVTVWYSVKVAKKIVEVYWEV